MQRKLFLILFLLTAVVYSQDSNELIGRILNSESQFEVPYATIQILEINVGIVANINGDFRIPLIHKTNNHIITISSIGYETKDLPLSTLVEGKENIIYLIPKIESLDQVIIQGTKSSAYMPPEEIVRKAITKIPSNYPTNPYKNIYQAW